MKYLWTTLILVITIISPNLFAQETLWASRIIGFSSQKENEKPFFTAQQALGPPNAMDGYNESLFSWASKKPDSHNKEYIHVGFDQPIHVQQIAIAESINPGAIHQIILYDMKGKKHVVFEKNSFRQIYMYSRLFSRRIPKTPYKVKSLKLVLNTKYIKGHNQIDAIGISNGRKRIRPKVNELKYSEIVELPENLGKTVNSAYAERLPIISPDGKRLYFTRKFHPNNMGDKNKDDIWISHLQDDGTWSKAQNIGAPLNNENHNFVIAVSPDDDKLYVSSAYKKWQKHGVAIAQRTYGHWAKPQALKIQDMYNHNKFSSYSVSVDGNILLMAIERADSYGDRDLYVSFKKRNGTWSSPKNLGPTINTLGMESSIFLAADYKTIYFASSGHVGYGGLDMYISRRLDDSWQNWSTPKNMGRKINTPGNDYNYTIPASGDYAYFASDFRSYGQSDLFRIQLPKEAQPEPVTLVTGHLIDAVTLQPIDNKKHQLIIPKNESLSISGYYAVTDEETHELEEIDGSTEAITEISKNKIINKKLTEENKKSNKNNFSTYKEIKKDILLIPLKVGQIIPMQNIFFDANKITLKHHSFNALNKIAHFLLQNQNLVVEVGGHTNGLCSDEFAQNLSQGRAETVAQYLQQKGIASNRIQYKGYGKIKPVASDNTVRGRKKNQRVELKILEILGE